MKALKTIIYNTTGEFLASVSWIRGLSIMRRNRGQVLQYHEFVVYSATEQHRIPCAIVLNNYVRYNYTSGAAFSRENVYLRDSFTCQYCGEKPHRSELTFDHVIPKSKGGTLDWENAVTACKRCNSYKEDRTPSEASMRLINLPYRPTVKKINSLKREHNMV